MLTPDERATVRSTPSWLASVSTKHGWEASWRRSKTTNGQCRSSLAIAAAHLERAWVAQQTISDRSDPGSDAAGVAEWAEEALEWMIEMSEWLAGAWDDVASTMERAAGIAAAADGSVEPSAEDLPAPTSFLDAAVADGSVEPSAEDHPAPTSFLDADVAEGSVEPSGKITSHRRRSWTLTAAEGSVEPSAEDHLAPRSFLDGYGR